MPGIGRERARMIIEMRKRNGPFRCVEDLRALLFDVSCALLSCTDPVQAETALASFHEHRFEPRATSTVCRDRVEYACLGGTPVHALLVRPRLLEIFEFRRRAMRDLMDADPEGVGSPLESGKMW